MDRMSKSMKCVGITERDAEERPVIRCSVT